MGGGAEQIETGLKEQWRDGLHLSEALALAVGLLGTDPAGGPSRASSPRPSSRSRCSTATGRGAPSGASPAAARAPAEQRRPDPRRPAGRRRRRRALGARRHDQPADPAPPSRTARPSEHSRWTADLRDRERVRHHLLDRWPAHADARRGGPLPVPQGRRVGPLEQRLPHQRLAALPRRRLAPRVRHRRVRLAAPGRRPRQGGGADHRGPRRRRPAAAARGRRRRRHLRLQEQHRLGRQLLRLPRELPRHPGRASSPRSPTRSCRSSSAARSPAAPASWSRRPRARPTP